MFRAYLRGIETHVHRYIVDELRVFRAYLRGIETRDVRLVRRVLRVVQSLPKRD